MEALEAREAWKAREAQKASEARKAQEVQEVEDAELKVLELELALAQAKRHLVVAKAKLVSTEHFMSSLTTSQSSQYPFDANDSSCTHPDCCCGSKAVRVSSDGKGRCVDFEQACKAQTWKRNSPYYPTVVCSRDSCACSELKFRKFGKYSVTNSSTGEKVKYCHYGLAKYTDNILILCNFRGCPCGNLGKAVVVNVKDNLNGSTACPFSEDAIVNFGNGRN
jgi:hypothetical protein